MGNRIAFGAWCRHIRATFGARLDTLRGVSIRPDRRLLRLVVAGTLAAACSANKDAPTPPGAIEAVRVTTNLGDVRNCRVIRHVDSRDTSLGCGPAASGNVEECLRYQVVRSGGDTLLMRGPAGEAYDCGGAPTMTSASSTRPATTPTRESVPTPTPLPERAAAAVSESLSIPATTDRSMARGCVYLGDVEWTACGEAAGAASGPCAEEARKLGGNLIVHAGPRAEVFWCRPAP